MPLTIECSQEEVDSALEMLWTLWHPVFVWFLFTLIKCLIFSFNYVILFILTLIGPGAGAIFDNESAGHQYAHGIWLFLGPDLMHGYWR